eukprot:2221542-Lingulodinium_polyedra.AAC.1
MLFTTIPDCNEATLASKCDVSMRCIEVGCWLRQEPSCNSSFGPTTILQIHSTNRTTIDDVNDTTIQCSLRSPV